MDYLHSKIQLETVNRGFATLEGLFFSGTINNASNKM